MNLEKTGPRSGSRLKLEVCAFFADEFRAALAAEERDDIEIAPMRGACDERHRPASAEIQSAQNGIPILRLMGVCSGGAASPGGHDRCSVHNNEIRDARFPRPCPPPAGEGDKDSLREFHVESPHSCFEFLLGPDKVNALLNGGAHLLTPAMVRAYPETLQSQNERTENLHAHFAESVSAWVVVDAGVATLTAAERAAFMAATGGKLELLPAELHLLRANLRAVLAQWEAGAAEARFAGQIASLRQLEQQLDERTRELRESEARLKETQRIAQLGSWELDIAKDRLEWSDEVFRLFEMDRSKFNGTYKGFLDAIHPDDRDAVGSAYARSLVTRKPYEITHRLLMSDGRIKWVTERCTSYFDAGGGPVRSVGTIQDVTEHKRVEEELKLGTQILNSISDTVFLLDPDGNFVYLNEVAWKSRGYTRGEMMKMNLRELNAPEFNKLLAPRIKAVMESGHGFFESAHRCKDGRVMPVEINVRVTESGGRKLMLSVIRDITERKHVEKELRTLSTAIEQSPLSVVITDLDAKIQYVNPCFLKTTGYSMEEAIGQNPRILQSGQTPKETYEELWKTLANGRIWRGEFINRRKNGELYWEEAHIAPVMNSAGAAILYVAVKLEITQRKRVEESLRVSMASLRATLDNTPYLIWLKDAAGRFVAVNEAFLKTTGQTQMQSVLGKTDLDLWPKELAEKYSADDNEVIASRRQKHLEEPALDGDRAIWMETFKTPVIDENGNILGTTGFARDITERREFEEELKRSNIELEQFSYAVSHDMRQPLRMISSYLQLIERGLGGQLDDEKRGYFNFAIEGAKRIDQMLVALLEYSRVGRKGEPPTLIESRALLDEVLQFLQPSIAEAQARISIGGEWPRIRVSHNEMIRLIQNLIGNAVKYRIAGRIPEISVTSEVTGNEWHLCVADNGIGIIPTQTRRLFQVFQRLQSREAYEGTGVGLALCRKIAERHKGRIWAESEGEGRGSKFHVVLPVLPSKAISATGGNS